LVVLDRMLMALAHQSSLRTRATFSWPTLYNLYFYMFRHFHVIIRDFHIRALLSYINS